MERGRGWTGSESEGGSSRRKFDSCLQGDASAGRGGWRMSRPCAVSAGRRGQGKYVSARLFRELQNGICLKPAFKMIIEERRSDLVLRYVGGSDEVH